LDPIAVIFEGKPEMARAACTQIALRTTVMIGALLVLLLMALLPGPVRWLLGSQQQPAADHDDLIRRPSSEADGSSSMAEAAGSGLDAEFAGAVADDRIDLPDLDPVAADVSPRDSADDPLPDGAVGAGEFSQRYREITSKLRELGAAYHRLETWEGDRKVYRFQCALSAEASEDGDGEYRTFEATGTEPADAMERVLADVRAWRNGGLY
jgi:hypothetical protein